MNTSGAHGILSTFGVFAVHLRAHKANEGKCSQCEWISKKHYDCGEKSKNFAYAMGTLDRISTGFSDEFRVN